MDVEAEIRARVGTLSKNPKAVLTGDTPLISRGLIDSLGIFELITFLEKKFRIKLDEKDMSSENFESIGAMAALVARKSGPPRPR